MVAWDSIFLFVWLVLSFLYWLAFVLIGRLVYTHSKNMENKIKQHGFDNEEGESKTPPNERKEQKW